MKWSAILHESIHIIAFADALCSRTFGTISPDRIACRADLPALQQFGDAFYIAGLQKHLHASRLLLSSTAATVHDADCDNTGRPAAGRCCT